MSSPPREQQNDVTSWFAAFPGLLWSIDMPRSRLHLLNGWQHPQLAAETPRLLKDSSFRKQHVVREDLPLLAEFWDVMANRQNAAVTFRLKESLDDVLLLQGWPHPHNAHLYMGLLKYAHIPQHFSLGNGFASCQMALTRLSYPVLLLDSTTEHILACNKTAEALFGMDNENLGALSTIAPGALRPLAQEAIAKAIRDDVWGGILTLRGRNGASFSAKVRISPAMEPLRQVVRVAFLEGAAPDELGTDSPCCLEPAAQAALQSIKKAQSLRQALESLLQEHCTGHVEALLFSDIKSSLGRVEVYAVGKAFGAREWGGDYAYEGTIAQDIERFELCSLIVDDTLDSIKSIDWVLFTPRGIRSYFAKPFFTGGRLEAVLILASTRAGQFPPAAEKTYAHIFPAFEEAVRLWRSGILS